VQVLSLSLSLSLSDALLLAQVPVARELLVASGDRDTERHRERHTESRRESDRDKERARDSHRESDRHTERATLTSCHGAVTYAKTVHSYRRRRAVDRTIVDSVELFQQVALSL
jgi:hypothetical protein